MSMHCPSTHHTLWWPHLLEAISLQIKTSPLDNNTEGVLAFPHHRHHPTKAEKGTNKAIVS